MGAKKVRLLSWIIIAGVIFVFSFPNTRMKLTAKPAEGQPVISREGTLRDQDDTMTNGDLILSDQAVGVEYTHDVDPYTPVYWGTPSDVVLTVDPPLLPGSVIPPFDDRILIENTTIDPYRKIANLEVTWGAHGTGTCTGWFIGPHTVITAGHCLYDHSYGFGWITQVKVIPARDEDSEPLGSQTVVATKDNVISVDGWVNKASGAYDYGAIILPDDTLGNLAGWFEYGYFSDAYLYAITNPTVTGYPGDKTPKNTMWADVDDITGLHYSIVAYTMDTYKGQSGSPVYHSAFSTFISIAVHAYGAPCLNDEWNCGPRINKEVADLFSSWGAATSPHTDCTTVGKPSLLSPSSAEVVIDNPVNFDWTDVSNNDSFYFNLFEEGQTTPVVADIITDSQHTVAGLLVGTYYWEVRANNISGCPPGEFTDDRAFTVTYPSAPTNVQASDGAYTYGILITTDQAADANEYHLWRATSIDGPWTYLDSSSIPYFLQSEEDVTANRTYYYRFHSCNDYGCSPYSYHDPGWRAMPPPENVSAGDSVYDEIPVTCDSVMDATYYKISRSESQGGAKVLLDGSVPTTCAYTDTLAVPGITYYYWVNACNAYPNNAGCSDYSEYEKGSRLMDDVPFALASDGTYTQTTHIVWSGIPESTYYKVFRRIDSGDPLKLLDEPTGTSYDDPDGVAGQVYIYYIQACNEYTCSVAYAEDTGWRAMPNPGYFEASDGTHQDRVVLNWSAVGDAAYYNLYRAESFDGTRKLLGQPTAITFDDGPDDVGRTYHYWVEACNSHGCGQTSYDTGYRSLGVPIGLTASDGTYTGWVHLYWNSVSGVTHYNVYRAETPTGEKSLLDQEPGHAYDDASAVPGKVYYYWVKACYETNCSNFGVGNSGWRAMASPDPVSASDGLYHDKVRMTWGTVPEASEYEVYRGTAVDSQVLQTTIAGSSYDDLSALFGQVYYYWVKACNSYICSSLSAYDTGYLSDLNLVYIPLLIK